jgi:hypothetical protein
MKDLPEWTGWQSVKNCVSGISLLVGKAIHCVRIAEVLHYLGTQAVNMYIERQYCFENRVRFLFAAMA